MSMSNCLRVKGLFSFSGAQRVATLSSLFGGASQRLRLTLGPALLAASVRWQLSASLLSVGALGEQYVYACVCVGEEGGVWGG